MFIGGRGFGKDIYFFNSHLFSRTFILQSISVQSYLKLINIKKEITTKLNQSICVTDIPPYGIITL